ncbi:MAG: DUF3987 domain-containing protein [Henriciella sp.]
MTDIFETSDAQRPINSVEMAQLNVWCDPQPLIAEDMKPQEFPLEAMLSLKCAIEDIHKATQAPIGLVAASVLSVANFAAAASYNVILHGGVHRPVSLMIITRGESGERKSAVDSLASKGVDQFQEAQMRSYRIACAEYDVGTEKEAPGSLPLHRLSNATLPGIEKAFERGPSTLYLCSDEAGRILGGHSLKAENKTASFAALSDFWDGKTVSRIYRGNDKQYAEASYLKDCRLCMHLLGQPEVLKPLFTDNMARGQGILARAMIHSPPSSIGRRFATEDEYIRPALTGAADSFASRIEDLLRLKPKRDVRTFDVCRKAIALERGAVSVIVAYSNEVEGLMGDGQKFCEARSFVNKSAEQAGRIAATLAVYDGSKEINRTQMEAAVKIARYFAQETVRMLLDANDDPVLRDASNIAHWVAAFIKENNRGPNHRELTRGKQAARKANRRDPALKVLTENGWLKQHSGIYQLNPKLNLFVGQ